MYLEQTGTTRVGPQEWDHKTGTTRLGPRVVSHDSSSTSAQMTLRWGLGADFQIFTVNSRRIPAGAFFPHTYDMNVDPFGGRNVTICSRFSVKSDSSPPYSCCQHLLVSTLA